MHAQIESGARLQVDETHEERAVYVVEGAIECDGTANRGGDDDRLRPGAGVTLTAKGATRAMFVGGAKLDRRASCLLELRLELEGAHRAGEGRLEQGRFPKIPGDDVEFIPLPEQLTPSRTTA